MSKIIIGIHGLGNKPNALTLAHWWNAAINEGLNNHRQILEKMLDDKIVNRREIDGQILFQKYVVELIPHQVEDFFPQLAGFVRSIVIHSRDVGILDIERILRVGNVRVKGD